MLLLKRLSDARRDGDTIHGVIRAIGSGFSRSRVQAVRLAATRALAVTGLAPDDIAALETAGTGRPDADAEEIQGIADAYASRDNPAPLRLGTLAAQIGHLGGASGMVSLLKATMALNYGTFPRPFAFDRPAPFLDAYRSLISVSRSEQAPHGTNELPAKFAAVNSCGGIELVHHVLLERGTVMLSPTPNHEPSAALECADKQRGGGRPFQIVHFDATVPRREKMRRQATADMEASPKAAGRAAALEAASVAASPPPVEPVGAAAPPVSLRNALPKLNELAKFLVDFVVERTEYPPEIVDLDVDLEADLGIDFFKKAQILAELNQHFDLGSTASPAPDDFATLRQVLDYLTANIPSRAQPLDATTAPPLATPLEPAPRPVPAESTAATTQPVAAPVAPVVTATPRPAAETPDAGQLAEFLVNFVVEQTGYPAEIVELDADLEADLGIDSIKKAQLFGELGEYFDVQPAEDLTLDDFPTLRHVLDYLAENVSATAQCAEATTTHRLVLPSHRRFRHK